MVWVATEWHGWQQRRSSKMLLVSHSFSRGQIFNSFNRREAAVLFLFFCRWCESLCLFSLPLPPPPPSSFSTFVWVIELHLCGWKLLSLSFSSSLRSPQEAFYSNRYIYGLLLIRGEKLIIMYFNLLARRWTSACLLVVVITWMLIQ